MATFISSANGSVNVEHIVAIAIQEVNGRFLVWANLSNGDRDCIGNTASSHEAVALAMNPIGH